MSFLAFNNLLDDDCTITVTNDTVGGSPADLTNETEPEKLISKQLEDSYLFILNGNKIKIVIENIRANPEKIGTIAILNTNHPFFTVSSVTAFRNATEFTCSEYTTVIADLFNKKNTYNHAIYEVDNGNTNIDRVEINITLSNAAPLTDINKIGSIFLGEKIELNIKPDVVIGRESLSKTDTSNGGQKYYSNPITLKTIKANISTLNRDDSISLDNALDYQALSQPLLFLPSGGLDRHSLYCTFKAMPTLKTIPAKDNDNNWYYSSNLSLIENR